MLPQTSVLRKIRPGVIASVSALALIGIGLVSFPDQAFSGKAASASTQTSAAGQTGVDQIVTTTPIKHIIYIVGENRSFDNIYATYQPKSGQKIWNLLSQKIVNADGTPGKKFALGQQFQATSNNGQFLLSPLAKQPYTFLPVPTISSAQPEGVGLEFGIVNAQGVPTAGFPQGSLSLPPADQIILATGGTGSIPKNGADTRIPGVDQLPSGPFQQT